MSMAAATPPSMMNGGSIGLAGGLGGGTPGGATLMGPGGGSGAGSSGPSPRGSQGNIKQEQQAMEQQQQQQQTMTNGCQMMLYSEAAMVPRVPLSRLIDSAIQKTYHDLTVLAELLHRKSDMERKIEIITFASRTRQMFVRILALVKWASSASKVDKCMSILQFLDKQSALFTESADTLSETARSTLVVARLPSFQVPAAVEVLTLGTYSKLPACIRDSIVPADPIPNTERKATLFRLNHIIEQRLVFSQIPLQMRKDLKIINGRVIFHVEHEFNLCLTVMGDNPNIPWRVLWLEILVEDKETGEGRELVHPMQVSYIEHLVQTRIAAPDEKVPLMEAYRCLHSFCLSLQLEVLHAQAVGMCFRGLADYVKIDEYHPGNRLVFSYWRDQNTSNQNSYKIIIGYDQQQPEKSMTVIHVPELQPDEVERVNASLRADHISLEKLLLNTTQERSSKLLISLRNKLKPYYYDAKLEGCPPILQISCLDRCSPNEWIHLTIDNLTGQVLCHVPAYMEESSESSSENSPTCLPVDEIEDLLNEEKIDFKRLAEYIDEFRIWVTELHCRRGVETKMLKYHKTPPFTFYGSDSRIQGMMPSHPPTDAAMKKRQARCVFQFKKHPQFYMVIFIRVTGIDSDEAMETDASSSSHDLVPYTGIQCELNPIELSYYLVLVEDIMNQDYAQAMATALQAPDQDPITPPGIFPRHYLRAKHVIHLDPTEIRSGLKQFDSDPVVRKGQISDSDDVCELERAVKRIAASTTISNEIVTMVTQAEDRLAYISLSEALDRRGVDHKLVELSSSMGPSGSYMGFDISNLPPASAHDEELMMELSRDLVSCRISLLDMGPRVWHANFTFCNIPVQSQNQRENGPLYIQTLRYDSDPASYDMTIEGLYADWISMAALYRVVKQFAKDLKASEDGFDSDPMGSIQPVGAPPKLCQILDVKSFSYRRIVLGYGIGSGPKCYTVAIFWKQIERRFSLCFSIMGQAAKAQNPHTCIATQLQHEFNQHKSIKDLMMTLNQTLAAMVTVTTAVSYPMLGIVISRPAHPVQTFTLIALTSKHLRLTYRNSYCLDLTLLPDGFIAIKDGAFSNFDRSRALEDLSPIPGLKAFLSKYVDKSATLKRRQSQTEDDNPPSPITTQAPGPHHHMSGGPPMHALHGGPPTGGGSHTHHMESAMDSFLSGKLGSPAPPPSVGSNPHTPASPHNSMLQGGPSGPGPHGPHGPGYVPSPGGSFPHLASPPSHPPGSHGPPDVMFVNSPHHPVPSPGSFMPGSSPHPHPSHSPAFMGHDGSHPSPYPMVSPMSGWPGSPSMGPRPSPRPSYAMPPGMVPPGMVGPPPGSSPFTPANPRILPQKPWAAAVPIVITQSGLDSMFRPISLVTTSPNPPPAHHLQPESTHLSPLERFLGCVYLRRCLAKEIQKLNEFELINTQDPNVTFKNESLTCTIMLHTMTMQSLHMKITPMPPGSGPQSNAVKTMLWTPDETDTLQKYFEYKIACQPYKPDAFLSYCRIISMNNPRVQKDFIQIMKMEMMMPERAPGPNQLHTQLCLTVPPNSPPISTVGMSAIINVRGKLLFFVQFTRNIGQPPVQEVTFVVPFIYDLQANTIVVFGDRSGAPPPGPFHPSGAPLLIMVQDLLKQFSPHPSRNDCIILPAIRHIVTNLHI